MFDIPGFNPSGMSDEELMNRQVELNRRLSYAARFSGSDMTSQLLAMIQSIEFERRERILKTIFVQRNAMFPDIIETEPDLAAEHKRKVEDAEQDDRMSTRRRQGRERVTLKKTSTPTKEPTQFPIMHREGEPSPDNNEEIVANSVVEKGNDNG
jgi:hypothetical protein